jgi:hypothetical protein
MQLPKEDPDLYPLYLYKIIKILFILFLWGIIFLVVLSIVLIQIKYSIGDLDFSTTVSIFNLSDNKLKETLGNDSRNLDLYDSIYLKSSSSLQLKLQTSTESLLSQEFSHRSDSSNLIIYIYSQKDEYCIFSADVTSIYYNTLDNYNDIQNISPTIKDPVKLFSTSIDWNKNEYVFPGRYSQTQLPKVLRDKRVIGYYPIKCSNLSDETKVKETVLLYKNFDPIMQRQKLNEELNKINT